MKCKVLYIFIGKLGGWFGGEHPESGLKCYALFMLTCLPSWDKALQIKFPYLSIPIYLPTYLPITVSETVAGTALASKEFTNLH